VFLLLGFNLPVFGVFAFSAIALMIGQALMMYSLYFSWGTKYNSLGAITGIFSGLFVVVFILFAVYGVRYQKERSLLNYGSSGQTLFPNPSGRVCESSRMQQDAKDLEPQVNSLITFGSNELFY
jgi:membrane-bound ClpP family serine protease